MTDEIARCATLYCFHRRANHNGPDVHKQMASPNVKWTMTACSAAACKCRKYTAGPKQAAADAKPASAPES